MRRAFQFRTDEEGLALITVILVGMVVFVIGVVMVNRVVSDLNLARHDREWQRALHVADAGIDHALFQLSENQGFDTGENTPAFPSLAAERAWALGVASDPLLPAGRVTTVTEGEWVIVKPSNDDTVYSVGFVPNRAEAEELRVLRVAYDFAPFQPTAAILTDGDLMISGNPSTSGISGNIHANGDIDISGNPLVSGTITASGAVNGLSPAMVGDIANSGGGFPNVFVPEVEPLELFELAEYVYCPDSATYPQGFVMAGPEYAGGPEPVPGPNDLPCTTGTVIWDFDTDGDTYRGFKGGSVDSKLAKTWDYSGNTRFDGTYFFHEGSVKISGNPGEGTNPWEVTLLVSATIGQNECDGGLDILGGDIEISGNVSAVAHEKGTPLVFVARRDLKISGNPLQSVLGVLMAHEQIDISGNPNLTGVILSNDDCDSATLSNIHDQSIRGNATVIYDGGLSVPLGDTIRITHWNEL